MPSEASENRASRAKTYGTRPKHTSDQPMAVSAAGSDRGTPPSAGPGVARYQKPACTSTAANNSALRAYELPASTRFIGLFEIVGTFYTFPRQRLQWLC